MRLVRRAGSPNVYVTCLREDGKRVRTSTFEANARKAALKAAEIVARIARDTRTNNGGKAITIAAAVGCYVDARKGRASHAAMVAHGAKAVAFLGVGKLLKDLTPVDLAQLVAHRQVGEASAQTIAHELGVLRAATRYVASLGHPVSPALLTGNWRIPARPMKTRYLSISEYHSVYRAMDPVRLLANGKTPGPAMVQQRAAARDLLVILCHTGMRWNEAAKLTWGQIDFVTMRVRVWGFKGQRERLTALPTAAAAVVHRRLQEAHARGVSVDAHAPVFSSAASGSSTGFRSSASCKPILQAMNDCGLNNPVSVARYGRATAHSLRHTFASLTLQNGGLLAEVQETLGHATMHMTRRYAHLSQGESTDRLAAIMDSVHS